NLTAYLLLENCLIWLSIPSEAIEYTRDYLQVMFLGLGFVALYNFFAAVLRSIGNTLVPLIFLAISAVVNIALDLLFILVFRWEEMGAAAATVIAQALSAVCLILYFFKTEKQFLPQKKHCHYHPGLLWEIIKNSALTALQQSVMNLGILMVQGLVNRFGFAASAAFAAVVKIDAFAYLPAQDFGNGFATFVAQNYGAGNEERILRGKRIAIGYTTAFCILSSVLVLLFSKELMLLFVEQGETEILEIGIQYLHIEGAFYFAIGILFLLYGYYRGLGKPWISLKLTIISLGTRVALAYLLSAIPQVGLTGIWWAVPIGWILADLVGLFQAAPKQRANIDQAAHK
ncbi:MAG: MATE family efflux transporter, partial [Anaerovoracaceae bacterium]